ncbi:hypothetical protein LOK49_LG02G02636 [Camellia lanceoleosa]|uniref:Uncharacterized protein n=1 Tax=Camellia lanceoleosa TaxID=1840588 RepID=A0ACC0IQU0_9ERIC|nr:hypothetical protein LOK49_LG02G02636 [Camellia lanceoleosa]
MTLRISVPKATILDTYVKYSNSAGSNSAILRVLAEADGFELANHKDIKKLSDFGIASMNKVQGCLIESCDEIETIVGAVDGAVLPNLEHLYIKNLPKLESIFPCLTRNISKVVDLTVMLLSEDGHMSFQNSAALDPFRPLSFDKIVE